MENSSNKSLIKRIIIAVAIMVLLLVIDIASKLVVHNYFNHDASMPAITVIEDFFWIDLTYNPGALAGIFSGLEGGRVLLSILSIIGSVASIWYLVKKFNNLNIWYRIALYLFIPGCIGNLIDRVNIYNTPGVIDFLSFKLFGFYYFPVFNFADMCLTISIFVFAVGALFFVKDEKKDDEVKVEEKEEVVDEVNHE